MKWSRFLVLLPAFLSLIGCQSAETALPTATPEPTPQLVRVAIGPAALPAQEALTACSQAIPGVAVIVEEAPLAGLARDGYDLSISLGEPGGSNTFLAAIGRDRVSLIAHKDIPLTSLSLNDLKALLRGDFHVWGELLGAGASFNTAVTLYGYPPDDPLRLRFETAVLGAPPSVHTGVFLVPDPAAMLGAVSGTPGAFGYLPQSWMDDSVTEIPFPEALQPALTLPLLVAAPTAPSEATENLARCLQGPTGQRVLEQKYLPAE